MNDIRDIKPPVPLADPAAAWLPWVILGLLALAGLLLWLRRRRRTAATRLGKATLDALAALSRDGGSLPDRDYAFRLAGLVREILEARYSFPATAMTVAELVPRLRETSLPRDQAEAASELLGRAERTCFAGEPLGQADRERDHAVAVRLARGGRR